MVIETPGSGDAAPGTFVHDPGRHRQHEHIVFTVGNGTLIRFSDPRRFGLMTLTDRAGFPDHPLIRHLGPEPTGPEFTGPLLAGLLKGRNTSIKSALLDQRVVAGLGNIYACEALYVAGISPRRRAATVQGGRAARLADAVRTVLDDAIAAGGSSLRDHVAPTGELGYFQAVTAAKALRDSFSPAGRPSIAQHVRGKRDEKNETGARLVGRNSARNGSDSRGGGLFLVDRGSPVARGVC